MVVDHSLMYMMQMSRWEGKTGRSNDLKTEA